jgi:serine/threonine protein kinase
MMWQSSGYTKDVDWWAVGILSYELLLGDPPFRGRTAQEVYKNIVNRPMADVRRNLARFEPQTVRTRRRRRRVHFCVCLCFGRQDTHAHVPQLPRSAVRSLTCSLARSARARVCVRLVVCARTDFAHPRLPREARGRRHCQEPLGCRRGRLRA